MPQLFTREVHVPRRDEAGQLVKGPDGQPIIERTLGTFTFRRPTTYETMQIGVRLAQNLRGQAAVDATTALLAEVYSVLPHQVEAVPEGWQWDQTYDFWEVWAIYEEYKRGLEDIRRGGTGHARPA